MLQGGPLRYSIEMRSGDRHHGGHGGVTRGGGGHGGGGPAASGRRRSSQDGAALAADADPLRTAPPAASASHSPRPAACLHTACALSLNGARVQ